MLPELGTINVFTIMDNIFDLVKSRDGDKEMSDSKFVWSLQRVIDYFNKENALIKYTHEWHEEPLWLDGKDYPAIKAGAFEHFDKKRAVQEIRRILSSDAYALIHSSQLSDDEGNALIEDINRSVSWPESDAEDGVKQLMWTYFLKDSEGEIVGYIQILNKAVKDFAFITYIVTRGDFHGLEAGTRMMLEIMKLSREQGFDKLAFAYEGLVERSAKFYTKLGLYAPIVFRGEAGWNYQDGQPAIGIAYDLSIFDDIQMGQQLKAI